MLDVCFNLKMIIDIHKSKFFVFMIYLLFIGSKKFKYLYLSIKFGYHIDIISNYYLI
jgi:hypothetical protein